jgi:DtxR family Mn-dependent transcriptional regulator
VCRRLWQSRRTWAKINVDRCFPRKPSRNYLKTIFLARLPILVTGPDPDGTDRGRRGVVPGTATTMVKALSESGLVYYEPYMGVRLTPAGEKLAGLVLRRHR